MPSRSAYRKWLPSPRRDDLTSAGLWRLAWTGCLSSMFENLELLLGGIGSGCPHKGA